MKSSVKTELLLYAGILSFICAAMLVAAPNQTHGYYTLLRIVVFLVGLLVAITGLLHKAVLITILSAFVAIVFNPLIIVELSSTTWESLDFVGAVCFFALGVTLLWQRYEKNSE